MELFDVQPMATTISKATLRPMIERVKTASPMPLPTPWYLLLWSTGKTPNRARLSRFLKKLRAGVGSTFQRC